MKISKTKKGDRLSMRNQQTIIISKMKNAAQQFFIFLYSSMNSEWWMLRKDLQGLGKLTTTCYYYLLGF